MGEREGGLQRDGVVQHASPHWESEEDPVQTGLVLSGTCLLWEGKSLRSPVALHLLLQQAPVKHCFLSPQFMYFGLPSCFGDDPGATVSCSDRRALPDIYLWLLGASRFHVISGELQDEKFVAKWEIQ